MPRYRGTNESDIIRGSDREDIIYGFGGDDIIYSNGGPDTIAGGEGADTVYISTSGARVAGDAGDDLFVAEVMTGASYTTFVDGGSGRDTLDLSAVGAFPAFLTWWVSGQSVKTNAGFEGTGLEVLRGGSGGSEFLLRGATIDLEVHGGEEGDYFDLSTTNKAIAYGGGGFDYFFLYTGGSQAYGGSGVDYFQLKAVGSEDVIVDGGADKDTIVLQAGNIDLEAGIAIDSAGLRYILTDIENADLVGAGVVAGDANDNVLVTRGAGSGAELYGRGGNDTLFGARTADLLDGGEGDDALHYYGGANRLIGGAGSDTAYIYADAIYVRLQNKGETIVLIGTGERMIMTEVENLVGSGRCDFRGNRLANWMRGGNEADTLDGERGNDELIGLIGADLLIGGEGADRFTYLFDNDSTATAADTIFDFDRRSGDKIVLTLDANTYAQGIQDFTFIKHHAFSGVAGQLRYEIVGEQTMIYGDSNGDMRADLVIRLDDAIALKATDFIL